MRPSFADYVVDLLLAASARDAAPGPTARTAVGPDARVGGRARRAAAADPRSRRLGALLRPASRAAWTDRFTVVAPDLAGFGRSDKPRDRVRRARRTSTTSTRWPPSSGSDAPIVASVTRSAVCSRRSGRPAAPNASGARDRSAPYPSPDEAVAWTGRAEVPAAARITMPLAAGAIRLLAVPSASSRGYPPAIALDYARQTLRSRKRTMRSVLYDPSVAGELERRPRDRRPASHPGRARARRPDGGPRRPRSLARRSCRTPSTGSSRAATRCSCTRFQALADWLGGVSG